MTSISVNGTKPTSLPATPYCEFGENRSFEQNPESSLGMKQPKTVLQQVSTLLATILTGGHVKGLPVYIGVAFEQQARSRLKDLFQGTQCGDPTMNRTGG